MAKITIYLPDQLEEQVRAAGIPLSPICQRALEQEVKKVEMSKTATRGLKSVVRRLQSSKQDSNGPDYSLGKKAGVEWAREKASYRDLADLAEYALNHNWSRLEVRVGSEMADAISDLGDDLLPDDHDESKGRVIEVERNEALAGFVDGACQVWTEVRPLL
jgi:hypothetical protein